MKFLWATQTGSAWPFQGARPEDVTMVKSWELNARHPGVLQGLTKHQAITLYGKETRMFLTADAGHEFQWTKLMCKA